MTNLESNRLQFRLANALIAALMCVLMLVTLYPLYYTLVASFSDARALLRHSGLLWLPLRPLSLQGYAICFSNPNIVAGFANTLFYLAVGTCTSMALTVPGAYIVSRKYFLPRQAMMKLIMFTMFFSGGLIPLFFVVRDVGIYNTRWAMILPYAVSTYNLIIMRSFFLSIPESLEESALLDGANDLQILLHVIMPLSTPVLAVIGMYYGVGYWNSWYPSLVFHRDRTLYPLQMLLRELLILNQDTKPADASQFVEEAYTRELVKYCTISITTVPILAIYPFLQRYFVKGVMVGAIKG